MLIHTQNKTVGVSRSPSVYLDGAWFVCLGPDHAYCYSKAKKASSNSEFGIPVHQSMKVLLMGLLNRSMIQ